ncbi:CPBP family intramembrane glutamic endopeptidase [Alteromonas facilis]|uniref:CPBP family intramembrane glutamic endopeptidase n=1 Tax=Alteromonas facilis TaxID=2048004 RepID=UPI000C281CC9|nr:CPBP family intramembrane glutamic endopeptidase [Alteromonas facilis]
MASKINSSLRFGLVASLIAIILTASLDATGHGKFSAFALIPLIPLFAWLGNVSRKELGYVVGDQKIYLQAAFIPLLLVALLSVVAWSTGAMKPTRDEWLSTLFVISFNSIAGILLVAITEEGFFRGIVWKLMERGGLTRNQTLWSTTALFVIWHLSAILLSKDYAPALLQVPIYLVNATLLGLIWGLLRVHSGSIWPSAIYHSVWNALVYQLFGFGLSSGDLGVEPTWVFGPEIGLAGFVLNGAVVVFLLRRSSMKNT